MNIKRICLILSIIFVVSPLRAMGSENTDENLSHHPIWPMIVGAGLITQWVYNLGDDTEEGQRNVKALWGGAALASLSIVLYQKSNDQKIQLSLGPVQESRMMLLSYEF